MGRKPGVGGVSARANPASPVAEVAPEREFMAAGTCGVEQPEQVPLVPTIEHIEVVESPRIESTVAGCSVVVHVVSAITRSKAGEDAAGRELDRPMGALSLGDAQYASGAPLTCLFSTAAGGRGCGILVCP